MILKGRRCVDLRSCVRTPGLLSMVDDDTTFHRPEWTARRRRQCPRAGFASGASSARTTSDSGHLAVA